MMETQNYWEDAGNAHSMQVKYESLDGRSCKDEIYRMGLGAGYCEGNLNFATASEDDEVYTKKKVSRQDPMSHRIIEKRRRDRMNNCLADLSRLIPAEYLKKGRGRVEKTEIIEMAIRHMKHLQGLRQDSKLHTPTPVTSSVHAVHQGEDSVDSVTHPTSSLSPGGGSSGIAAEHYRLGFQECISETMHFLVESENYFARDTLCVQLVQHLQQHCDKILATSDRLGFPHPDIQTFNGATNGAATNGINSFAHANGGPLTSMCPNGNGVGHMNNNNNNSHSNLNNISGALGQHHPMLGSSNGSCSSSGVSSFDSTDSPRGGLHHQRTPLLIPPPNLGSDDSNHSCHSHASFSGCLPPAPTGHQESAQQQRPAPATNYKFKNSIKQRFSAERIKTSGSPPPSSDASSSKNSSGSGSPQHQGVPIFALHDNGGFYVPLTVEAALLRPHMGYPELGPEGVLHPVTISVNFNHATTPVWSHPPSPPPHQ